MNSRLEEPTSTTLVDTIYLATLEFELFSWFEDSCIKAVLSG